MKTEIAIIGNGCAAQAAVEAMRGVGFAGRIDVFSDSQLPAYNPMLTTYYLGGKIPYESLLLPEQDLAVLHLDMPIVKLCGKERYLMSASGERIDFGQCLIASGASPFVPPIEGRQEPGVFTVRTAEDVLRIQEYMQTQSVRSALVVGASMVGIKVVEYLLQREIECWMADAAPYMFPQAAHPNCAALIEKAVAARGIRLRMGGGISRIESRNGQLHAYFSDTEEPVSVDVVFLCIGVRPNLAFVDPAEIQLNRGIVVDDWMRTSCEAVYAAGDCTAGDDVYYKEKRNIGLMESARRQGRTAGRNLAGVPDRYCGSTAHNITHFLDMDFVGLGAPGADGDVYERTFPDGRYIRIVQRGGQIRAVNLLNMKELAGVLRNLFFKSQQVGLAKDIDRLSYEEFVSYWMKKHIGG